MDYKNFYDNSVKFLVEYAKNNKLQSYVLGISGGIDSTIVAAIASEACKQLSIPLIGRSLPSITNTKDERQASSLVGETFCSDFREIGINHKVSLIKNFFDATEYKLMSPLQYGNIKARFRMIYLYHLASLYKGCVLDTDNKTEHELGFWTIHGDVGDVNCGLIHLWKTEVYELAKWLTDYYENNNMPNQCYAMRISGKLIPTDGNGVSTNDCEQFGLDNYKQVDDVLQTMYYPDGKPDRDKNMEYMRLIEEYDEQGVDKVMLLHQNSEFKRKHLPIYPSIKTFM